MKGMARGMSFENRFYTSKEMYREYVNKVLCGKIYVESVVVALLCVLALIVGLALDAVPLLWLGGAGIIMVLAVVWLAPRLTLKSMLDYDQRVHGGEHPQCVVTFGEAIKMEEGNVSVEITYDQVIAWHRLQTCSVLMFTKQNGIMYVDDGFVGDASGFDAFIKEKCVNLK